uniref:C2 domain-containing protein n=1 Tax=Arion vulgaris TaxID=1028688 RepID=A0A0B6ZDM6_9EUPU
MLHVQLTWLWLASQANELDRVVEQQSEEEIAHVGILMVFLDSARNLPRGKKSLNEPSPQAVLSVGQQIQQSMIKHVTSEPRWEQNFRFLLHNPNYQNLDIEIMDAKSKKLIGGAVIKLKLLLTAEDMVMDQKFRIKTSDPDSYLQMRLCLRILTPNFNPNYIDDVETLIHEACVTGTPVDQRRGDSVAALYQQSSSAENGTPVDDDVKFRFASKSQQTETVKAKKFCITQ